jgi:hypothetical protein
VFGIALHAAGHILFLRASDEVRAERRSVATKRIVISGLARVRKMVQGVRAPVVALADPDYEGSCELLEHIGFVKKQGRLYQWPIP